MNENTQSKASRELVNANMGGNGDKLKNSKKGEVWRGFFGGGET